MLVIVTRPHISVAISPDVHEVSLASAMQRLMWQGAAEEIDTFDSCRPAR